MMNGPELHAQRLAARNACEAWEHRGPLPAAMTSLHVWDRSAVGQPLARCLLRWWAEDIKRKKQYRKHLSRIGYSTREIDFELRALAVLVQQIECWRSMQAAS